MAIAHTHFEFEGAARDLVAKYLCARRVLDVVWLAHSQGCAEPEMFWLWTGQDGEF